MNNLVNIYNYRELLKTNIKKDIRGKYKGSVLGILWSFLNPLLQVVVYWLVFPYLLGRAGTEDNYLCYLVTGIIPWTFFTNVLNQATVCIKLNAGIVKKVYFPREVLPISQSISGLVNFLISCIIIVIFCVGTGAGISYHILYLPLIAFVQWVMILGISFILSSINVYIQDIEYIVMFMLNMGFYATPILYSMSVLPEGSWITAFISINPMTIIVRCYRDIFLYHVTPDFMSLGFVCIFAFVVLIFGYFVFKKLEKGFAEKF